MAAKKTTNATTSTDSGAPTMSDNPTTTESVDSRPRRAGSSKGRAWPVIRSYYSPTKNSVIDVLEVTKVIAGKNGQPPKTVILEKHVHCQDEELQTQYTTNSGNVAIPSNVEIK